MVCRKVVAGATRCQQCGPLRKLYFGMRLSSLQDRIQLCANMLMDGDVAIVDDDKKWSTFASRQWSIQSGAVVLVASNDWPGV